MDNSKDYFNMKLEALEEELARRRKKYDLSYPLSEGTGMFKTVAVEFLLVGQNSRITFKSGGLTSEFAYANLLMTLDAFSFS